MLKIQKYIYSALIITPLVFISTTISPGITQLYASSTSYSNSYKEAEKAVKKAIKSKTLYDISIAKIKVDGLQDGVDKDYLLNKINRLAEADIDELIEDATLIIEDLEQVYSSDDINDTKNYIIRANNALYKLDDEEEIEMYTKQIKELNEKINTISMQYKTLVSEANELTNNAIKEKTEESKNKAQKAINKLEINSEKRIELQKKIDDISIETIPDNTIISQKVGWIKDNDKWYYMNNDGTKMTGWINDQGNWYYLNNDGIMQTGWIIYKGDWYYLNNSGAMMTGWVYSNNHWYYLKSDGIMAVNTIIDGYKIDSFGVLTA